MRRLLTALSALVVLSPLYAPGVYAQAIGSSILNWTNPIANVDDSPLTDLTFIDVYQSRTSVGPYSRVQSLGLMIVMPTTYTVNGLWNGTYYWQVKAVNSYGVPSAPSNTASKVISLGGGNDAPAPRPPTGLTAQ